MATLDELKQFREQYLKKVDELFELLDQENLLIKNSRVVEHSFIQIFNKLYAMQDSLDRKKQIFEDDEKFQKFLEKNSEYGITKENFMFDFRVSSVHYLLSLQEMISRFLVEILDIERLEINKDRAMLGTTIKKIAEYRDSQRKPVFLEEGLRTVFSVKMRNTLGHDKWWFDNDNKFCTVDGDIFTEEEFYGEIVSSSILLMSISTSYLTRKFPESLQQVKRQIESSSLYIEPQDS